MRGKLALLLWIVAGLSFAGCSKDQKVSGPAQPNSSQQASQEYSNSFSATDWTIHLRQLDAEIPTTAETARQVWENLFAGMAEDSQTQELLKRLLGGLTVAFVVVEAKQTEDKQLLLAPPPDGSHVAIRVAALRHQDQATDNGVPVQMIAFGLAISIQDAVVPGSFESFVEYRQNEPAKGRVLSLAMDDYMHRHAPGWTVILGPFNKDLSLPVNIDAHRQSLDEQIEKYSGQAKEYFDALRRNDDADDGPHDA